jgi:hypothetical protein
MQASQKTLQLDSNYLPCWMSNSSSRPKATDEKKPLKSGFFLFKRRITCQQVREQERQVQQQERHQQERQQEQQQVLELVLPLLFCRKQLKKRRTVLRVLLRETSSSNISFKNKFYYG